MNYWEIKTMDTANGPGLRVSLFVSGCAHACPWCFNQKIWDLKVGEKITEETIEYLIKEINKPHIEWFSLLWWEPMNPAFREEMAELLYKIRQKINKPIWIRSGFTAEYLLSREDTKKILSYCDVLVDWRFKQDELNLKLCRRWSSNQRVLDIKKTIQADSPIWLDNIPDKNLFTQASPSDYEKLLSSPTNFISK